MDAGILPGDPMAAVVDALADVPEEVDLRIAPALAQMKAATAAIEKAAARPMLTSDQIRYDVLPKLLAAYDGFWITMGVMVALAMLAIGFGAGWWWHGGQPEAACHAQDGGIACGYWQQAPQQAKPTGGR